MPPTIHEEHSNVERAPQRVWSLQPRPEADREDAFVLRTHWRDHFGHRRDVSPQLQFLGLFRADTSTLVVFRVRIVSTCLAFVSSVCLITIRAHPSSPNKLSMTPQAKAHTADGHRGVTEETSRDTTGHWTRITETSRRSLDEHRATHISEYASPLGTFTHCHPDAFDMPRYAQTDMIEASCGGYRS